MAFKYVILLVAAVGAASLQDRSRDHSQQQQQQRHPAADSQDQRNDDSVGYDFSYSVHDPNTGDVKSQEESRRNGNVRGHYSWVDADGNRQIVEYQADDRNGFNSEHRSEPVVRPRPASHVLVPAPLYTIDTLIAPVWTSQSRSDNSRSRSRQDRNRSDRNRDQDRDEEDQRDQRNQQRDGQDNERDNQRNEQDNRDDRDNRDNREQRRDEQRRDEQRRDEQRRDEQRRDEQRRDDQSRDEQRQRSRDGRGRGRESHAQSEVRFQAADVAYQYSN